MENILDYIYNGEIQIYQDDLDRFLTIANRFQLEGLIGGNEEEQLSSSRNIYIYIIDDNYVHTYSS